MQSEILDTAASSHGGLEPTRAQSLLIKLAHHSFLKRGAFRPTFARLLHLLRAGPIDAEYQGAAFRLHYRASATESGALLNPHYNIEELDFLKANLQPNDTFIDIGANIGTVSLPIARFLGSHGRVLAIEPHPEALARLDFNRRASKLETVSIIPVAATDSDGEVTIVTGDQNLGASRIGDTPQAGGIVVSALTLLTILQQNEVEHIGAIKIDVEGFEDRVLTGFFKNAPRSVWPRAIVIEHISRDQWQTDCISLMEQLGYRTARRTRSNTMLALRS